MKTRLRKGKDYHGWAFKDRKTGRVFANSFVRSKPDVCWSDGKYVKVRLIEVEENETLD